MNSVEKKSIPVPFLPLYHVWQQKGAASGKTFTFSLYDWSEGGESFKVLSIQGTNGGLWVKRWTPAMLGINLTDAPAPDPLPPSPFPTQIMKTTWYDWGHVVTDVSLYGQLQTAAVGAFGEVSGNGQLLGNEFDNRLRGGAGNDELSGEVGRDVLVGGSGNDKLVGGDDGDALYGGDDDDALKGNAGGDVIDGGAGKGQSPQHSDRTTSRISGMAANDACWRVVA